MYKLAPITDTSSFGLKPGQVYDVALISLDLEKHTQLIKLYSEGTVSPLIRRFQALIRHCVLQYGGEIWNWAGDGGLCVFHGSRRCDRAVLAGILCLHELAVFNLDPERNELRHPLRLRVAANEGRLEYREPVQNIFSELISDTFKIQEDRTQAGHLTLTENLYLQVDDHLKSAFTWEREFEGRPLYYYQGLPSRQEPSDFNRDELAAAIQTQVREILDQLDSHKTEPIDSQGADNLSYRLADTYEKVRGFRSCLDRIETNWSEIHLYHLLTQTDAVVASEATLWQELVHHLPDSADGERVPLELRLLRSATIAHHAETEVELRALVRQLRRRVKLHHETDPYESRTGLLSKQIAAVVTADEVDRMTEFLETIRYSRLDLLHFLYAREDHPYRRPFVNAAWHYADLVLIEDQELAPHYSHAFSKDLFSQLVVDSTVGPFFQVAQSLLSDPREPTPTLIEAKFRKAAIAGERKDFEIVLRCLLAGHESVSNRYAAARHASAESLLEIAVYPRASVLSLWIVAQRLLEDTASHQLGKIFFDSVKSRLHTALAAHPGKRELDSLRQLIELFFQFDFFVENRYFEELENLAYSLSRELAQNGVAGDVLKIGIDRLTRDRQNKQFPTDRLPERIEDLPSGLRRHLARNGAYVEVFACDPIAGVAKEVRGYIREATVNRIALYAKRANKPVNENLLSEIAQTNPRLFDRFRTAGLCEPEVKGSGASLRLPPHEVRKIERLRAATERKDS